MSNIITFDSSTKTITNISKSFSGDLILNRTYNNVDILIIGRSACLRGSIRSLDASKTIIHTISVEAFLYCMNLVSLKLPSTIISLGDNSFGVTALTNFTVPKDTIDFSGYTVNQSPYLNKLSVDEGNANFASKNNFIFTKDFSILIRAPINAHYYDIPNFKTLKGIKGFAFSGCKIRTFIAESSLTDVYYYGFHACHSLRKIDLYLSSVTEIVSQAFYSTENIEIIVLPKQLTIIKGNAFQNVPKLKEIIIPESVTTIENGAFKNLNSLTNIYLLCKHQTLFENKIILSSIIDTRPNVIVHASSFYEGTIFGGFQIQKDLHSALAKLIYGTKICTKQNQRTVNNLLLFITLIYT